MNNMYQVPNYSNYKVQDTTPYYVKGTNQNDERLAGGFVFPFLLGGVTGAAVAPAFWRPGYGYNNRPPYYNPAPYPYQYPYQPRRWF